MLTGEIRSQIDAVWNVFWSGGISNPLEVIEQNRRGDLHLKQAVRIGLPSHPNALDPGRMDLGLERVAHREQLRRQFFELGLRRRRAWARRAVKPHDRPCRSRRPRARC